MKLYCFAFHHMKLKTYCFVSYFMMIQAATYISSIGMGFVCTCLINDVAWTFGQWKAIIIIYFQKHSTYFP